MASQPEDHLKSLIDTWVHGFTHPGAIVGMFDKDGKDIFYHEANTTKEGFCEGSNAVNYKRDTIFRIYSMTKPITAVAAMILVERGLLSLDDDVSKWIPSFKNLKVYVSGTVEDLVTEELNTPLKVHHLFTHTSGIVYGLFGKSMCDKILAQNVGIDMATGMRNTSLSNLCEMISKTPLLFQPGTKFEYGLGLDVLGHVIELVSGQTLDIFFENEIFQPLNMIDTSFFVSPEKLQRFAKCYEVSTGMSFKQSTLHARTESFHAKPENLSGGGGLLSTIDDYSRFTTMLLNKGIYKIKNNEEKRLLSKETINKMTTNVLPNQCDIHDIATAPGFLEVDGGGYGFGLSMYILTNPNVAQGGSLSNKGEYGWGGFASTSFFVDPISQYSCIFMTQLIPSNVYPIRGHLRYLSHWVMNEKKRLFSLETEKQHENENS